MPDFSPAMQAPQAPDMGASPDVESPAEDASEQPVLVWVHALQPGTWPASPSDLTVTMDDIAATAAAYDPTQYLAPVVIGHPETDSPAWGMVLSAEARDDGLWLLVQLCAEMAELVRAQMYGAVSLALWPPQAPGNPAPGAWSIKHLGFLGAVPPAVKGLQRVQLAAGDAVLCTVSDIASVSLAERPKHSPPQRNTREIKPMPEQTPDAVQLAERERALAERERTLAARERDLRRQQFAAELAPHVAAARIVAGEQDTLVQLMERLCDSEPVTLAEGAQQDALAAFRGFLDRLPARVELREVSRPDGTPNAPAAPAPRVPAGMTLSEDRAALHNKAVAYMAAHPGTEYLAAVRAVERA